MGTGNYSDEFKRDAVQQIRVRGYPPVCFAAGVDEGYGVLEAVRIAREVTRCGGRVRHAQYCAKVVGK